VQARVPVLPRARANIFARYGQDVERDEPQPVRRGGPAGKYRTGDRGEILDRLAVALADRNQLAVKRGAGRDVGEVCEQRSETSGEIGAVARPPAYLSPGSGFDQETKAVLICSPRVSMAAPVRPSP
jgi:hypothetical protein